MNIGDKRYTVLLCHDLISVLECEVLQIIPPAPWAAEWASSTSEEQKKMMNSLLTEEMSIYGQNAVIALEGGALVRIVTRGEEVLERLSVSKLVSLSDAIINAQEICYETIDNAVDSLAQIRMLEQRILFH